MKLVGGALAITAGVAQSQTKTALGPKFEVASIKPCKTDNADGRRSGGENLSPGRLHLDCSTVKDLVQMAYVLFANGFVNPPWSRSVPIEGGPAWINSDRYEIDAKAEDSQSQGTMHGPMLQALLEDRLKLKTHRETREAPVYALTVAKGGPKLKQFEEGSCTPVDFTRFFAQFPPPELDPDVNYCGGINPDGRRWLGVLSTMKGPNAVYEARGMNLDDFFKIFVRGLDRPVIDKTGITGRFDFHLEFELAETTPLVRGGDPGGTPPAAFPDDPNRGPSIFTAIQEQLGLKLESATGLGEFFVIDHVEKPSGN